MIRALRVPRPTLVAGFDFRPAGTRALAHALGMLSTGSASELHVVHVVAAELARDEGLIDAIPGAIADVAETMLGVSALPSPTWCHVRSGRPRFEIRRIAFELGADLVVLGARGVGAVSPDRVDDRAGDPYAPFSVLVAGDGVELDPRAFEPAKCPECRALRTSEDAINPWCRAHLRRGVPAARRLDLPHSMSRVVH